MTHLGGVYVTPSPRSLQLNGLSCEKTDRIIESRLQCKPPWLPLWSKMRYPAASAANAGLQSRAAVMRRAHLTGDGGATAASAWPLALSALATKPEAFIS